MYSNNIIDFVLHKLRGTTQAYFPNTKKNFRQKQMTLFFNWSKIAMLHYLWFRCVLPFNICICCKVHKTKKSSYQSSPYNWHSSTICSFPKTPSPLIGNHQSVIYIYEFIFVLVCLIICCCFFRLHIWVKSYGICLSFVQLILLSQ